MTSEALREDADDPGRSSLYMPFAKLETDARYNLASSGVADCQFSDLALDLDQIVLNHGATYGFPPLAEAIAARFRVSPACVVIPGGGCSFANHLAMATILSPGEAVVMEEPGYELIEAALRYFRVTIRKARRAPERGFALDDQAIAEQVTAETRLVVITNLHNPSSAPAEPKAVAAAAAACGDAWLLLDEVYLETTFADAPPTTAFREDGRIIVTSSLTKAYGLSGLRCGWILAPRELAHRMRRLNDLFAAQPPHLVEQIAVAAFERLSWFAQRARHLTDTNRAAYREILGGHEALDQFVFDQGTTVFPRLRAGGADALFRRLRERFETSLVPGRFFGADDHVRIGLGGDPAMTREGLTRIAEALMERP